MSDTFGGTRRYMAPEVLNKQKYNQTIDYYALGIILFEIIYHPITNKEQLELVFGNLRREDILFPSDWDRAERWMKNATKQIKILLHHDPSKRKFILKKYHEFENPENEESSNEPTRKRPHTDESNEPEIKRNQSDLDKNWVNLG